MRDTLPCRLPPPISIPTSISCRDYLQTELSRREGIFGLLFMRQDGSLFGSLPEGSFFLDDPMQNPRSEKMRSQILNVPFGQTVWVGPISGAVLYGFEKRTDGSPEEILCAVKEAVDTFVGDAEQFDDLTMMCLTYKG